MLKWIVAAALALFAPSAFAQTTAITSAIVVSSCSQAGIFGPAGRAAPLTVTTAGVLCTSAGGGGGGGTSSAFNDTFPADGTAAGFLDNSSGDMVPGTVENSDGGLLVHVTNGGSGGTASNFGAAFPTLGTAIGASDGTDMQPLLVDGSGNLKVTQQGNVTVVGTGTFAVQAAQSGTWTVQPGNTANTTAWLVTGTGGTFPATQSGTWNINNISGTVSLPTGAATAAKQPALGTAGSASSDVITIQGIASMTAVKVDGTGGTFPVTCTLCATAANQTALIAPLTANTATATNSLVIGAQYNSTLPTATNGQQMAYQMGTRGSLNVTLYGANSATSIAATASADALGNNNGLATLGYDLVWSNTNSQWDRVRGTETALNVTAQGLIASAQVAQFDDITPTTITENQFGNVRMSANRNAYTTIRDAAGNERGVNVTAGNALTVDGSATTQPVSYATTGSGTATGALRVELANNGTGVMTSIGSITSAVTPGTAAGNLGKAEDAVAGSGDTGVMALAVQGSPADSAADGDYSPLQMKNGALWVSQVPTTANGLTTYFLQPTASDNHANIKNGAGQVYFISATNNSATLNYMRLYNAASGFNGCNSATNLVAQWAIPASTSGAGFVANIGSGLAFSTGISICVTSGYATTDTTAATASAMSVTVGYK